MEVENPRGTKTISEAVREGSLIDVSEVAKAKKLECRTFLCASLWEKDLGRSEENLGRMLRKFAGMYNFLLDYTHYGPMHVAGLLGISKDMNDAFCTGILEPNDEFGLALVIVPYGTEKELK